VMLVSTELYQKQSLFEMVKKALNVKH